jgi:hypothetical protein
MNGGSGYEKKRYGKGLVTRFYRLVDIQKLVGLLDQTSVYGNCTTFFRSFPKSSFGRLHRHPNTYEVGATVQVSYVDEKLKMAS